MANYDKLRLHIQNYIKGNGNREITGFLLQDVLLSIVDTLGDDIIKFSSISCNLARNSELLEGHPASYFAVATDFNRLASTFEDMFYITEDGESIGTRYNFFSEKEVSSNGLSIGSGGSGGGLISQVFGKSAFGTITTESNAATFNAYAIDSLYKRIVLLENKEVGLTGYATETWVLAKNYITAAALSPYLKTADANSTFATLVALNALSNRFDALDDALNDDVSGKINTWNEIVDFLDEYSGSEDLATVLSGMNADIASRLKSSDFDTWKNDVYSPLAAKVSTAEGNISTNAKGIADNKTAITNLGKKVTANEGNIAEILKWFAVDSDGNLYTTYNFYSTKEISANGLSIGSGSSDGGLISQVFGTTAFGTIASESNSATFNAYAIDSLYKRIVSLEGKATAVSFVPALTSGKQIGTLSIDGVSTVLYAPAGYAWSEVSGKPTLIESEGVAVDGSPKVNRFGLWQGKGTYWSIGHDSNYVIQAYATANGVYLRSLTGNIDSGWKRILREGDAYSKTEADSTFLKLSGGTINGGAGALEIKRNGPYLSNIKFSNTDGELGKLGFVWANNPAFFHTDGNYYPLYHTGNFNPANYLPLTGGSIESSTIGCPLYIANTKETWNVIGFKGNSHSDYAYFGLGGDGNFFVTTTGWTAAYGLIHSGNIGRQSVSKSNALNYGGLASNLNNLSANAIYGFNTSTSNRPVNYGVLFQMSNKDTPSATDGSSWIYQIAGSTAATALYTRFTVNGTAWSDWKTIAFTDSNVASANKATLADTASTLERYTVIPMTAETAGKWRQFAKLQASYQYHGRSASFQLSVSSSSGKNGAVCDVYAMMYQQDALGNAPIYTIQTNCDDRKLKIAAVLNYDSSGSTITLYAYCPTIYTNVSMVVPSRNGDVVSIGTELLSELPSGTVITPDKTGTSFAATKLITASGNNYAYHSDASKYTVFGTSGYNCYVDGVTTYFRYGANSTIGVTLNSSGNTTIGSTGDLAGTTYKLYVNGSTKIAGTIYDVNNIYPNSAAERYIGTSSNPFKYIYAEWFGAATNSNLAFGANNAVHMVIKTSGNVLIGTTTDTSGNKLQVNGTILSTPARESAYSSVLRGYQSGIVAGDRLSVVIGKESTSKNAAYFGFTYDGSGSSKNFASIGFHSVDNILCVAATSYVGIGTTSPKHKLHVYGNIAADATDTTNSAVYASNSNGAVALLAATNRGVYDANADRWIICSNGTNTWLPAGNVGIGASANEHHKLYVHGSIYADGNIALSSRLLAKSGVFCSYESTCGAYMEAGADGTYAGIYTCNNGAWQSSNIYLHNNGNVTINKQLIVNSSANLKSTLSVTGLITASSGVKVASGQALTFLDASGKEHKLTYDSTAGAFKFDGNILVLGDGQFNAIN